MKAESSILVIIFAIAVTNIGLGESRFFFTPNFWMTDSLDHKDAVVDLKLNPYREVVMKRHPSQDAVGLNRGGGGGGEGGGGKGAGGKAIEKGIILIDQVL